MIGRSWCEIDLDVIKGNCRQIAQGLYSHQEIMAVVKANAYGHGDIEVSEALNKIGINSFAVSNIDEAIRIRKAKIDGQILVLGYTPISRFDDLIYYNIEQAVISNEYAQAIIDSDKKIAVHVAIDTGMRRVGIDGCDLKNCMQLILKLSNNALIQGLFTHLSDSDSGDTAFTEGQICQFERVVTLIKERVKIEDIHYANSCGTKFFNKPFANKVRVGLGLYHNLKGSNQKTALTWKSVVTMVKWVEKGEPIGYGRSYFTTRKTKIATVSTGYADGYDRRFGNLGEVIIKGKRAKVIGKVCMDQFMVDVTEVDGVAMGDEVILLGEGNNLDFASSLIGTIPYELLTSISSRVPRAYIGRNKE